MPITVSEWFGRPLSDTSQFAEELRRSEHCPFIDAKCKKTFNDRSISGVCSVSMKKHGKVCICPQRLYAGNYEVLTKVARIAFGSDSKLVHPRDLAGNMLDDNCIVPLGHGYAKEVRLPGRGGRGQFFVDWVLCQLDRKGSLVGFVAVEVQSIDTTGTYRPEVERYRLGERAELSSKGGLNWENVNKRILPQLIYKGHVLRREVLCSKGLFFVCPSQVYFRIQERLGESLVSYDNLQPGCITFMWYDLSATEEESLTLAGQFSTTVDQVALAFTSPRDLPDPGVYQSQIEAVLADLSD